MVYRKSPAPESASTVRPGAAFPTRSANSVGSDIYSSESEKIRQYIQDVQVDLKDLENFYNISFSETRVKRIGEYLAQRSNELVLHFKFDEFDQEGKVDWLLIKGYIVRRIGRLRSEWTQINNLAPLLQSWAAGLVDLCERRQKVIPLDAKDAAHELSKSAEAIIDLKSAIFMGKLKDKVSRFNAYRAVRSVQELQSRMEEWYGFYSTYDPMFDWWVKKEWEGFPAKVQELIAEIREKLIGINGDQDDAIVGQPSGRESILSDLQSEVIPYSPEEIISIGEKEYEWCEKQMIEASHQLGFEDDWKKALEHVKTMYVEPGRQTYVVHELAAEAVEYVTKRDMVTIPPIADETWRTFMMSPEKQKTNPFFLGGDSISVSYPTATMSYEDRLMIMRGNSRPLSRSTVFHELIPGHHLQFYYMDRYRPYRRPFMTPFWTEGWAFYWEMILWDRGFPGTPESRIGMLFWRMHRCLRIIFSLKFHLGEMTPEKCIDMLVEKGGHERATAEGEVRRSFNGDYTPLYQAGYMLGALQFYALRKEVVDSGAMKEKDFHDRVLRENNMPVEMVRAILKGEKLDRNHRASWKFYNGPHD